MYQLLIINEWCEMKVDFKSYPDLSMQERLKSGSRMHPNSYGINADLCDKKSVNRGYSSGSSVSFGAAASKSLNMLNKVLDICEEHTVIAQNMVALVLAAVLRPIAIVSLPGKKNKEDKQYAAGHSIASGVIGFGFSSIVMSPLDKAAAKVRKNPTKYLTKNQYGMYENVRKAVGMAPDVFAFGILKACLTIALIPPILKYVFGVEKGKKPAETKNVEASQNKTPEVIHNDNNSMFAKPKFETLTGGQK